MSNTNNLTPAQIALKYVTATQATKTRSISVVKKGLNDNKAVVIAIINASIEANGKLSYAHVGDSLGNYLLDQGSIKKVYTDKTAKMKGKNVKMKSYTVTADHVRSFLNNNNLASLIPAKASA